MMRNITIVATKDKFIKISTDIKGKKRKFYFFVFLKQFYSPYKTFSFYINLFLITLLSN